MIYQFRNDISLFKREIYLRVTSGTCVVSMCTMTHPTFPPSYSPPTSPGCHVKKTCDVILLQKSTRGETQVCCHAQTARRVLTSAAGPSVPPDRSNRVQPIITNVSALVASPLHCPATSMLRFKPDGAAQ